MGIEVDKSLPYFLSDLQDLSPRLAGCGCCQEKRVQKDGRIRLTLVVVVVAAMDVKLTVTFWRGDSLVA